MEESAEEGPIAEDPYQNESCNHEVYEEEMDALSQELGDDYDTPEEQLTYELDEDYESSASEELPEQFSSIQNETSFSNIINDHMGGAEEYSLDPDQLKSKRMAITSITQKRDPQPSITLPSRVMNRTMNWK